MADSPLANEATAPGQKIEIASNGEHGRRAQRPAHLVGHLGRHIRDVLAGLRQHRADLLPERRGGGRVDAGQTTHGAEIGNELVRVGIRLCGGGERSGSR